MSSGRSANNVLSEGGRTTSEARIVVLAPYGQDGRLIAEVLCATANVTCAPDVERFCETLLDSAAGVLTTDALTPDAVAQLRRCLHGQKAWSDLPLVLLANRIDPASYSLLVQALGNVTIIQRPLDPASLITVVKAAVRAREKQYQVRDLLAAGAAQQEQIEALNRQLLLAVDAAEMGIWEFDIQNGLHRESAKAGLILAGTENATTLTQAEWLAHIDPDDRSGIAGAFEGAVRGDSDYKVEYRCATPPSRGGDSTTWVASKAVLVRGEAGEPIRLIGVVTDITERKQAEEQLRQRQREIEALNERLKRAMTETHHRVKNSLQLISAFVDMQANEHEDMVPVPELRHINTQVRTLAAVHDVLTQAARQRDSDDAISAKELLDKLFPMLRTMTGAKQLRYEIEDVCLSGRQGASLALIANELVLNAFKHSGSEVNVTLRRLDATVVLTVEDDGPGLPEDFDVGSSSHTGLSLVESLARWDLQGETAYCNRITEPGALIRVAFPCSGG